MKPGREPTLADVAVEAGVSLTTVSRVLNNRGYLSAETKQKVAQAIKKLNYRPNQVARALHGKTTQTIGVIVPTVALPFFGEIAANLEDALAEHGYRTLLCNSMGRTERERDYLDLLISHRVDGIICGAHNDDIAEYQTIRLPLVAIDRELSPDIPNIRCDNDAGGQVATEHLLRRGAKHPALVTSRSGPHNRREAGYRRVLSRAGIAPLVLTADFHLNNDNRARTIHELLTAHRSDIDSVFATDDLAAAAVLDWAASQGLAIPAHFKVVGFDGTGAIRQALPQLTTIRQPLEQIAQTAVTRLLDMIQGEQVPALTEIPGELIVGGTS